MAATTSRHTIAIASGPVREYLRTLSSSAANEVPARRRRSGAGSSVRAALNDLTRPPRGRGGRAS